MTHACPAPSSARLTTPSPVARSRFLVRAPASDPLFRHSPGGEALYVCIDAHVVARCGPAAGYRLKGGDLRPPVRLSDGVTGLRGLGHIRRTVRSTSDQALSIP